MDRVNFKAVVLGALLVLVLDLVVSTVLLVVLGGEAISQSQPDEQALHAVASGPSYLLASLVLGTLTTVVGGYAVARIAKRYQYFNGLALGVLGTLVGLAFLSSTPVWFSVLGLVTVIPASLLGSHIAVRKGT